MISLRMPAEMASILSGPLANAVPVVPNNALASNTSAMGRVGFGVRSTWFTLDSS